MINATNPGWDQAWRGFTNVGVRLHAFPSGSTSDQEPRRG